MEPENHTEATARDEYAQYLTRTVKLTVGDLLAIVKKSTFQRPLIPQYVRQIAANWDINLWEAPVIGQLPDGSYVMNEGQHRVYAAAEVLGKSAEIVCRLVETDNPGHLFGKLNTSKRRVQALDIFLAEASDPHSEAATLTAMVKTYGFDIDRGSAAYSIKSVAILLTMYRTDQTALARTLHIIHEVVEARGNEAGWTRGNVILTIFTFIRLVKYDPADLVKRLARANASTAVPFSTNEMMNNLVTLTSIYNKGRMKANRVDIYEALKAQEK